MADLVYSELPSAAPLLAKGLAGAVTGKKSRSLPGRSAILASHRQDVARLARYARVCGFSLRDEVPPTWLHVLTFPLQLALLSQADFPYKLAGLVHASNTMTLHRPVTVADELTLIVTTTNARAHRKGALFDVVGEVRVARGETAWTGTSTYLALGGQAPGGEGGDAASEPGGFEAASLQPSQQWRLSADLGRQYAAVSGDVNPIHLNALTARLFGFKRPIVHGMWTHARVLAALEPRLPQTYTIDVDFKRPILLPNKVSFATDGERFAVLNREDKPCLTGSIS